MAKLKPWYQVITPREDLRENRPMEASEFAVHLDHIRDKREAVSPDYLDPARFFERTFLTGSLLDLSSQMIRRLSGIQVETSAVFNMATQFGGGKTHSLTALYHLATHGKPAKSWRGVPNILSRAGVAEVPKADVAVFVGQEFDALSGRGEDGEPKRKTPWGEIAWQLLGEEGFAAVADHDAKGVAPAGDALRKMLPTGPTLILMDEILNYVSRGRKVGARDQFFNFLQNLSEEARARNNMVLCVSIPASEIEMNPEDQRDHESLKKLLDRVGKAIMMSADTEIGEIIRRRLFEWVDLPEDGRKTASTYSDWAIEHAAELSGISPDTANELFRGSYPFHPSVLSVFERKWQSIHGFQRTRGVLRLLALWVAHAFQEQHRQALREPLITFGSAPLEDQYFRAALFEQLGSSELEIPVTTDIAGKKDAHALRLDREAPDAIKKAILHRKVATAIFFESNGGMSQTRAEASLPEIRTSIGGPDINSVDIDNVLEGLVRACYYLQPDHNRYRFGLIPNLNKILNSRRGAVQSKEITERIKKLTQELFNLGPKDFDRRYFPERSNDVPNRPVLTLVILSLDYTVGERTTEKLLESLVKEYGGSGRTYKSALIFAVPDTVETIYDAARDALALEAIQDDSDTIKQMEESQERLLRKSLDRAKKDLKEAVWRSYRFLCLMDKDNNLKQIDLGQITSSSAASLVELYLNELTASDEITKSVSPARLIKYWPPALKEWSTKGVRDAFFSAPQLPRLLHGDAVKRAIADGVSQGLFGLVTKDDKQRCTLVRFNESCHEDDVEISDDLFITKAEDAQRLLEPPRLARLIIKPDHVSLKPGEQASFTCSGSDQYGQPFATSAPRWSATGGKISKEGLFAASEQAGVFNVKAEMNGIDAIAEVRINDDLRKDDPLPSGERSIRWQGSIPPQKWTNFYMKVLTRFANTPGLKLTVSFEVPVIDGRAESQAGDVRSGLKELGLSDDVQVR